MESEKLNLNKIIFPSKLTVTEQEIDISTLNQKQQKFYLDLFTEIVDIYTKKQKHRVIIGITGPTGSGKSVISALFQEIAKQIKLPFRLETVGIDAFHYPNNILVSQKKDGKNLIDYKGRFDTYDVSKLISALKSFSLGKKISLPVYSRKIHNPIENIVTIDEQNTLLLIEGLWLLYDQERWNEIGKLLDFSIFVNADKEVVRKAVVQRHIKGGRTATEANNYYETVDSENFDLVMKTKNRANKIIASYHEI